jgi:hypothetical protein
MKATLGHALATRLSTMRITTVARYGPLTHKKTTLSHSLHRTSGHYGQTAPEQIIKPEFSEDWRAHKPIPGVLQCHHQIQVGTFQYEYQCITSKPGSLLKSKSPSTDTSRPGKQSKRDSRPGAKHLRKHATNNSAMGVDERPAQHLQYCPDVLSLLHAGNPGLDNGDHGIHSDVICLEGPFCGLRITALAVRDTQNRGLLKILMFAFLFEGPISQIDVVHQDAYKLQCKVETTSSVSRGPGH